MLISFEGLDGSGKTTQARLLHEKLRVAGHDARLVREPGGTALGEAVRPLLLDPALHVAPMAELMLFSAARAQLVAEVIEPAVARGDIVLCDRFYDSTLAYQGGGRGVAPIEWLRDFCQTVTGGMTPARTYLVRVPPETALARRSHREADRMEAGGAAYHARIAAIYDALAAAEPDRFVVLDGTQPPEALHAQIWADLAPRLPGNPA